MYASLVNAGGGGGRNWAAAASANGSTFPQFGPSAACVGLYGVLNYAVIQRRREFGVRMALGARAAHVVRGVTAEMMSPVGLGTLVGLGAGLAFGSLVERILFEVKATDAMSVIVPLLTLAVVAALAAVPPAIRAVRIDPARTLRSE